MGRLRDRQLMIADRLGAEGYRFRDVADGSDLGAPVGAPDRAALSAVQALLKECGVEVPPVLYAFWDVVGLLEFQGAPPTSWTGCAYPDPISIVPADMQFMRAELETWLEREPRQTSDAAHEPFWFQVAGDHLHKAGYSGAGYYLSFDADDPRFFGERFDVRFMDYLRTCAEWAGFPGLAHCPDHKWPLSWLLKDLPSLDDR